MRKISMFSFTALLLAGTLAGCQGSDMELAGADEWCQDFYELEQGTIDYKQCVDYGGELPPHPEHE